MCVCTGRVAADVCRVREDAGTTHDRVVYPAILVGMIGGVRPRDESGAPEGPRAARRGKERNPGAREGARGYAHHRRRGNENREGRLSWERSRRLVCESVRACVRAWVLECATAGRILRCTWSRRLRGGGSDLLVVQAKRICEKKGAGNCSFPVPCESLLFILDVSIISIIIK